MKTVTSLFILFVMLSSVSYGQANTILSNLVSPVSVNQDLLPKTDSGQGLGSGAKRWKRMFLAANMYLGDSLFLHNRGTRNSFVGERAGYSQTTGTDNAAFGFHALYSNKTNLNNSAFGSFALSSNTGSDNSAFGYRALASNSSGYENTAVGAYTLFSNTSGIDNTAIGYEALYLNNSSYNTAIGFSSLSLNDAGLANTATGYNSLRFNRGGSSNTAMGFDALYSNISGGQNTGIGRYSLYDIESQTYNTGIGYSAGDNFTGNNNTFVGALSYANANGYSNSSSLGYSSRITASNQIVLGNSSVTSIVAGSGFVIYSDGRFKKNIREDVPGLEFIRMLKPVTYNYDVHGLNAKMKGSTAAKKAGGEEVNAAAKAIDEKAASDKEKKIYTGLIAQDVEKAAEKLNYTFSGVYHPQNDQDVYGLSYADFVMPLIKGMQELDKKTQEIDDLKAEVKQLKELVQQLAQNKPLMNSGDSYLRQNTPNPSKGNTIIPFQVAAGSRTAAIQIIETGSGKIVKTIPVSVNATQAVLNANSLAAGSYMYSLIVDGKQADSKQMILTK